MEIANLPKVPIAMNVALDKRKSKLVNVKGSTGLLDISSFPELTRNVSETQLLALKTAGSFSNRLPYSYELHETYIRFIPINIFNIFSFRHKSSEQHVGAI